MAKTTRKKHHRGKTQPASAFPDHRKMKLVGENIVRTDRGNYAVYVFESKGFSNPYYEIEVHGPRGYQSMTTKRFESISDAVARGETMVQEALTESHEPASKRRAPKYQKPQDVLDIAEELGWTFEWQQEEGNWSDYLGEGDSIDDIEEVLYVVLKDKDGNVLGSMGGVTFAKSSSTRDNQEYARSIERDLVEEAMAESKR